jgi:hypothetical protein
MNRRDSPVKVNGFSGTGFPVIGEGLTDFVSDPFIVG